MPAAEAAGDGARSIAAAAGVGDGVRRMPWRLAARRRGREIELGFPLNFLA